MVLMLEEFFQNVDDLSQFFHLILSGFVFVFRMDLLTDQLVFLSFQLGSLIVIKSYQSSPQMWKRKKRKMTLKKESVDELVKWRKALGPTWKHICCHPRRNLVFHYCQNHYLLIPVKYLHHLLQT